MQSDLIKIKNKEAELPSHVYIRTKLKDGRALVRKLPVIGTSDWLLIFEEDFCVLAVKDQYDEIEILGWSVVIPDKNIDTLDFNCIMLRRRRNIGMRMEEKRVLLLLFLVTS